MPHRNAAALAVGLLMMAPVALPALAGAPAAPPGPEGGVPGERLAAFIDLWEQRGADPGFVERWMLGQEPEDDAFQDLPEDERRALARGFLDWALDRSPGLRAKVHPPGKEAAWDDLERFNAAVLHAFFFEPRHLSEQMQQAMLPQEPIAADAPLMPQDPAFRDPLTGEPLGSAEEVVQRIDRVRTMPPVAPLPQRVPALEALRDPTPARPLREALLPQLLLDDVGVPLRPAREPLPLQPAFRSGPPQPRLLPPLLPMAQALTYTACGEIPGYGLRCFPTNVPFGTPILLELDDTVGPDVSVLLAPLSIPDALAGSPGDLVNAITDLSAQALAPGMGVTLRIGSVPPSISDNAQCRVDTTGAPTHWEAHCFFQLSNFTASLPTLDNLQGGNLGNASLPARVFVLYSIAAAGGTEKVIRLGIDGTADKIPETTTIRMRIRDLQALLDGQVLAALNITTDRPGQNLTLFAEWNDKDPDGNPIDPTSVSATWEPVPDLNVDIDAMLDGSRFVGILNASLSPLLTVRYDSLVDSVSPGQETHAEATLDTLPDRVRVEYERIPDGTRVKYDASSTIHLISAAFQRLEEAGPKTQAGTLAIHELPRTIEVFLRPDPSVGSVNYLASSVIPLVEATFSTTEPDKTTLGDISIANIPARIDVSWDTASDPQRLVYDSSSSMGPLAMHFSSTENGSPSLALDAGISSLPPYMEVSFTEDLVEFDARAGTFFPRASGAVGAMHLGFTTDGTFLAGLPSEDHAYLTQTPDPDGQTRGDLQYTGLQYAKVDTRDDELHLEVRNSAQRLFLFFADLPEMLLEGRVDKVPARITLDMVETASQTITYNTYGQVIDEIQANFTNKESPPLTASILVQHIPSFAELHLDLDAHHIDYTADSEVDLIDVVASIPTDQLGVFAVHLAVEGIPTAWEVDWPEGTFAFDSPTGVGSIRVEASNGPSVPAACVAASPNHLCAHLDVPAEQFAVDFGLVVIKHVEYRKLDEGVFVRLDAGGGQHFVVDVYGLIENDLVATLEADIDPLPGDMRLTTGPVILYESDDNFDLSLSATFGDPADLPGIPDPPTYPQGAAVRGDLDFAAFKGTVVLTGLPTYVRLDTEDVAFDMVNWRPTQMELVLDGILTGVPSLDKVEALLTLSNVASAPGAQQDLHASFFAGEVGTAPDSTKVTRAHFDSLTALGPLDGYAILDVDQARIFISNIPTRVDFEIAMGKEATTISYDAPQQIGHIGVGFALNSNPTLSLDAGLTLLDVPRNWTITLGSNGKGPAMLYDATRFHESDLDLALSVNASLFGGAVNIDARILAGFTNLGERTEGFLDDGNPHITSTPDTDFFFVEVSAFIDVLPISDGDVYCLCDLGAITADAHWSYLVDIDVTIDRLNFSLSNFQDFKVELGFPLVLRGTYGTFHFGWSFFDFHLFASVHAGIRICIDIEIASGCAEPLHYADSWDLHIQHLNFHKANDHLGTIFKPAATIICDFGIDIQMRPHYHGSELDGFTIPGSGGDGGNHKWYIIPDFEPRILFDPIPHILFYALGEPSDIAADPFIDCPDLGDIF